MTRSEWIESGLLELYVLGQCPEAEAAEIAILAARDPEIAREIRHIADTLESYAREQAREPDPTILPFLLATIDYMSRLEKGEKPEAPPLLHPASKAEDYAAWLERPDLQLDRDFEFAHARIIGRTAEALTAIVWLSLGSPPEMHTTEYERFLILEGSCEIEIEGDLHRLGAGDMLSIPLFKSHSVRVTSDIPCKLILQRVAA